MLETHVTCYNNDKVAVPVPCYSHFSHVTTRILVLLTLVSCYTNDTCVAVPVPCYSHFSHVTTRMLVLMTLVMYQQIPVFFSAVRDWAESLGQR